jgi:tetratricopeptide (TPR) repeat protein
MHPRARRLGLSVILLLAGLVALPQGADALADSLTTAKQSPGGTAGPAGGGTTPQPPSAHHELKPPAELTPDLVYAVLVGQIAAQRGDQRMAFTHFLHAAQLAASPELAELATQSALALGDPDAVQRSLDIWLELAPQSLAAHQIAAYARLEANDTPGALAELRQVIILAGKEGRDGYMQAARMVSKVQSPERRLEVMKELTAGQAENADAWFATSMVAAGAGRYDEAVAGAQRASELRSDWNEPRIFLIRVLVAQGKNDKARQTLESFVAKNPDDHALRLLYAQMLVEDKDFSHARNVFEYLLRDKPKEPDVLFALGVLSLQLEDLAAAREYFTRLRDTGQRQGDSAYYLGQVEELAKNLETAVSWYDRVEGEHALDAQVRIARVRAEQGDVARAREMLRQLRDQWPDDAVTLYLVEGEILRDAKQPNEALKLYDAAVAAHPANADLLYARALQAVALDRMDIMEEDLKAIIGKDPKHADALNALGYSLADRTERYEEALSYIKRALELKPDDPAVLDSMGWVQFRLGHKEDALKYLRKAVDRMPDGEIAAHLGEVLWAMGRHDEAQAVWDKALAESPDHEYLLKVISRHRVTKSDAQP